MKVTVIGGGSTYTPELIMGFVERAISLPLEELWLMDIDRQRLDTVGGFAQRMVKANGAPFKVILSEDQREAVSGASYVITQFRVGMMPARRSDEYLGLRHNLVGQETTGIGGMAKALRTIPIVLDIANDMRQTAPGAMLLNFTNPAGLVTEALTRYASDVPSVGVCNVGITTKMQILAKLARLTGQTYDPDQAILHTLGLNHLTWHYGFTVDGQDLWPQVFNIYMDEARQREHPDFDPQTLERLGMLPNGYLQYYYYTDQKLKAQQAWPPSRAEAVMEIEKDLLREYGELERTQPPEGLMKRGGAYYSTLATQVIDSHYNDRGQVHTVNVRHNGAVSGWPADWVVEMPVRIDRAGLHPLPAQALPPYCSGLVGHVKAYELETVEAAVNGDRKAAYLALLSHPLGPSADRIEAVLDDLLETNKEYLPQFFS